MLIDKNAYLHHWQREFDLNLYESRLAFFAKDKTGHTERLPEEYVHGQNILGNTIEELEKEITKRQGRTRLRTVLTGTNNIKELITRKACCENAMYDLNRPISSRVDFDFALKDIVRHSHALELLRGPELDQVIIEHLRTSELGDFFSPKLTEALEHAQNRMVTRDKIYNFTLTKSVDPKIVAQAQSDWMVHEKEVIEKIKKEKKKDVVDLHEISMLNKDLANRINWINRRIAELEEIEKAKKEAAESKPIEGVDENYVELFKKQVEEDMRGVSGKIHKNVMADQNRDIVKVSKLLSYENKLELSNILLEARHMKETQVMKYLGGRYNIISGKFDRLKNKKPPRFSDIQAQAIKKFLKGFSTTVINNPEALKHGRDTLIQIANNLDKTEEELDHMDRELMFFDEMAQNPEGFKREIACKFENIKTAISQFTPEKADKFLADLDKKETAYDRLLPPSVKFKKFKESEYSKKRKSALEDLKNPDSPLKKWMDEVNQQIRNIDKLEPEEIVDIKVKLDSINEKLLRFSGDTIDSDQVIEDINKAENPEKIMEILQKNLGSQHYDLVKTNEEFEHYVCPDGVERNLKVYTKGKMVFYHKGGDWKIIVNGAGIDTAENLKKQITHELLHYQFETNEKLKQDWLNIYTKEAKWPEGKTWKDHIKNEIIALFDDKEPPSEAGWTDEAVLSELYAMKNEVSEGKEEKMRKFADIIKGSDLAAKSMRLDPAFIRGYEGAKSASDVMESMEKGGGGEGTGGGGAPEETGGGSAERFEFDIKKNADEIKRLIDSEYVKLVPGAADVLKLMKEYNDETLELNEFLKKDKSPFLSYKVKKRIDQVTEDLVKIEKQISGVAEKMPNTSMNPIRDLWNRSQFLSLDDIFQVAVDIKEWWTRRHTRRKADHAARIGSALFDKIPLPVVSEFGLEAAARFRKAEEAEVDEWKNRLSHLDARELTQIIHNLSEEIDPNKDMFKAVIRILADKGRINWRDDKLWKLLNKLQNGTELKPGDRSLLKNPILLRQKLHKAFGEIFENYDEYLNLERTTGSNYGSGKEKYFKGFDKIQDQLTERLQMLLRKHRDGEEVDPQEYEGIIEYCIKKGKSSSEDCYFHLMVGVASGLLYADRPLALDGEYINTWPCLQWIYHQKPPLTKKDYEWYCKTFFEEEYDKGVRGKKFNNFFWTEINNDTMVVQRVRKSVSERGWDHDWIRSFAPLGDANTAKRFLDGKSGQQEQKDTAVENAYVGALQWFEENAKNPHKIDARKEFARQIAWVTMIDGIVDGIAFDRGANDISTRGNASIMNAIPREANIGNHAHWTTKQHKDQIRDFIEQFDRPFFELIRDEVRAKTKEGKESLGKEVRDYLMSQPRYASIYDDIKSISEIDDVFRKLDAIIICMVQTVPEEDLYRIISTVKLKTEKKAA